MEERGRGSVEVLLLVLVGRHQEESRVGIQDQIGPRGLHGLRRAAWGLDDPGLQASVVGGEALGGRKGGEDWKETERIADGASHEGGTGGALTAGLGHDGVGLESTGCHCDQRRHLLALLSLRVGLSESDLDWMEMHLGRAGTHAILSVLL